MGQKVHPIGFRLGYIRTWDSKWFAQKDYAKNLHEDLKLRKQVKEALKHAAISRVVIERAADKIKISIHTAKPGIIIGKKGQEVDRIKAELQKMCNASVYLNIKEIREPELDAQLVAENVALQLERRVTFRRAMKRAVSSALKFGGKGIRIKCAGRLGGAEMARTEQYLEGRVPLHTLRADIDYGFCEAHTTYGLIGVKVWIFKREITGAIGEKEQERPARDAQKRGDRRVRRARGRRRTRVGAEDGESRARPAAREKSGSDKSGGDRPKAVKESAVIEKDVAKEASKEAEKEIRKEMAEQEKAEKAEKPAE